MCRTSDAAYMRLWKVAVLLTVLGYWHLPSSAARLHPVNARRKESGRQPSSIDTADSAITTSLLASASLVAGREPVASTVADGRTLTYANADAASLSDDSAEQMSLNGSSTGNKLFAGSLNYDLDNLPDLQALLQAHRDAQEAALQEPEGRSGPRAIKVETRDNVGLGNRVPSIVTGFVMALFTRQAFLLESSILQHVQLPLAAEWSQYAARFQQVSRCSIDNITRLIDTNNSLCGEGLASHAPVLTVYNSIDYDMPFLQVNTAHQQHFSRFFPDGEVFHKTASYLFSNIAPVVQTALQPYLIRAQDCLVGLHLRTKKHAASAGVQPVQFAGIAKALAQSRAGNVFIAADQVDVFKAMEVLLPSRDVWWSDLTYSSVATSTTAGGNPGTEISAIVDLLLLSKCRHIVVTPSSSFGAVAAGLAGVAPVYATYGTHNHPFLNTWFWKSVTSEPCCFKLSRNHYLDSRLTVVVKEVHPLYYFHNQCHH